MVKTVRYNAGCGGRYLPAGAGYRNDNLVLEELPAEESIGGIQQAD